MKVEEVYPGARITGKWRVTRVETPEAPTYKVQWENLREKMPTTGAQVEFRGRRYCITEPDDERDCSFASLHPVRLGEIPGGEKIAALLGVPFSTYYVNLELNGRSAFGVIPGPGGQLYADFPVSPHPGAWTTAFEVWTPESPDARLIIVD